MNNSTTEQAIITLARISASSTIKFLMGKTADEKTTELRNALQMDFRTLEKASYIGEKTTANEHKNTADKAQIATLEKENAIIKARLKKADCMTDTAIADSVETLRDNEETIAELKEDIKARNEENAILYNRFSETLGDGIDLFQIAFLAIWERKEEIEKLLESEKATEEIAREYEKELFAELAKADGKTNEEIYTFCVVNAIGNTKTIVITGKTVLQKNVDKIKKQYRVTEIGNGRFKDFCKVETVEEMTIRAKAQRDVRGYINKQRAGVEGKKTYIVVGQDDEGNDLLLQNSKLETMGGVDSWEDKELFNEIFASIQNVLTARQSEIVKLLVYGFSRFEIAKKLNISKNTIDNHVSAIQKAIAEKGILTAKKN